MRVLKRRDENRKGTRRRGEPASGLMRVGSRGCKRRAQAGAAAMASEVLLAVFTRRTWGTPPSLFVARFATLFHGASLFVSLSRCHSLLYMCHVDIVSVCFPFFEYRNVLLVACVSQKMSNG